MKAIKIHGMAPDNIGDFHQAGATLTVSDDEKAGCIDAKRAEKLVKGNAAAAIVDKAAAKEA